MLLAEASVNVRDVQETGWAEEGPDWVWKRVSGLKACHFFSVLLGIKVPLILCIRPWGQAELSQGTPRAELNPERFPDWRPKEYHQPELQFLNFWGSELTGRSS